jgi:hypothetical protein
VVIGVTMTPLKVKEYSNLKVTQHMVLMDYDSKKTMERKIIEMLSENDITDYIV